MNEKVCSYKNKISIEINKIVSRTNWGIFQIRNLFLFYFYWNFEFYRFFPSLHWNKKNIWNISSQFFSLHQNLYFTCSELLNIFLYWICKHEGIYLRFCFKLKTGLWNGEKTVSWMVSFSLLIIELGYSIC